MPSERFTGLAAVLDAIRSEEGITQPVLTDRVGLGRSVVAQRVASSSRWVWSRPTASAPRPAAGPPRRLRLRADAGYVLGVDIATNELLVGLADLAGNLLATRHEETDVSDGPEAVFAAVERMGDELLDATGARGNLWSVGVGMPGPVAFDDGDATSMPTMPDWDGFPTRARLAARWAAPVWMDNRVNLSALGERRVNPVAAASRHTIYLGGGESIGAAVVVDGRLYRGARGLAGEIGHVPVPGRGTPPAAAATSAASTRWPDGAALVRDGRLLAETGQSPALAAVLAVTGTIRPIDITLAADKGDPAAQALLHRSARLLGNSLATLVSVFNPDLVILGGGMARARAHLIDTIREAIYRRALPAATQGLRIEPSAVDMEIAGVIGACSSPSTRSSRRSSCRCGSTTAPPRAAGGQRGIRLPLPGLPATADAGPRWISTRSGAGSASRRTRPGPAPGGTGWTATSTPRASGSTWSGCTASACAACRCSTADGHAARRPGEGAARLARVAGRRPARHRDRAASSGWSSPSRPRRAGARPAGRGSQPADAMKKVVWSETVVEGGRPVEQPLAAAARRRRALPGLPALGRRPRSRTATSGTGSRWPCRPTQTRRRAHARRRARPRARSTTGRALLDGSFADAVSLPRDPDGPSTAWIEQVFDEPVTVGAVTVGLPGPRGFGAAPPPSAVLEASDDGVDLPGAWRSWTRPARQGGPGPHHRVPAGHRAPLPAGAHRCERRGGRCRGWPTGVRLPPILRRVSEFLVSEFALFPGGRVHQAELKAGFAAAPDYYALDTDPARRRGRSTPTASSTSRGCRRATASCAGTRRPATGWSCGSGAR